MVDKSSTEILSRLKGVRVKIAELKSMYDKHTGSRDSVLSTIKEQFDVSSLEEAVDSRNAMKKELDECSRRIDSVLTEVEGSIEKFYHELEKPGK
jgi:cell division protein ZapA (FtsZ GTPase activity inhibitor)